MRRLFGLVLAIVAAAWVVPALAQPSNYPSRNIRIIVPFPPGGGTDLTARIVAERLTKSFGQTVIVENRPGAASQIGIEYVVRARPDGYTLLWSSADGISVLPAVKASMPYRIPESLTFVSSFASFPLILGVTSKLPIHDMKEFVEYAKAHPGQMHYSSSGAGGGGHLEPAYMASVLGLDMVHVPFDGAAPAVVAVAGGHVDFTDVAPSTASAYISAGTVRAIATSGRNRTTLFPDLPTVGELGYPQLTEDFHYGMYAPAGTPPDVVKKLRDGVEAVLKDPATPGQLRTLGLEPLDLDGPAFRDFVVKDLDRWTLIAKTIGFHLAAGGD
jgi:tripartite-type tricarboxylate transporter receptor subunit TctC